MDSSVEKILSVCIVLVLEFGKEVDNNSSCIPSGRTTDISSRGAQNTLQKIHR